eukprot:m.348723 g.348723  ORF g.348723 m.348723 type:complete len:123 (-) comp38780_c0_seq1:2-370(-)
MHAVWKGVSVTGGKSPSLHSGSPFSSVNAQNSEKTSSLEHERLSSPNSQPSPLRISASTNMNPMFMAAMSKYKEAAATPPAPIVYFFYNKNTSLRCFRGFCLSLVVTTIERQYDNLNIYMYN